MTDGEWAEMQRQLTAAGLLVVGRAAQDRIQRLSDISPLIEAAQRSNVVMLSERTVDEMPVSYTHLTLPTILLV